MLLSITTTRRPASDLSYLLHKHPDKVQQVEISAGIAHIFYPEVAEEKCTISLLLDIDPVGLVRRSGPAGNEFALEQYVNDRPYVASSFMSAALIKAFSTAMNGHCKDKPELVDEPMPLEVEIAVLPVRGGEELLRGLFEPLGYTIDAKRRPIDPNFPQWGDSRYFTVRLTNKITVQQLLSHLYILIPVCDNDKHYWVGRQEIDKLLEKGKDWLSTHPARELITLRYLKHQKSLVSQALETLLQDEGGDEEEETQPQPEQKLRAHDLRRGQEYLRIIYGPEYTRAENLNRLKSRGLSGKRSLALREFALGVEGLQRFVNREPLRRIHECVFAVLALESEPLDPRL